MSIENRSSIWNTRHIHNRVAAIIGVVLSLFHVYTGVWGSLPALMQRSVHLGLGLFLIFLLYPTSKKTVSHLHLVDYLLALASLAMAYFPIYRYDWITAQRFGLLTPLSTIEKIFAILAILLILEAVRRVVGTSLMGVIIFFLLYVFIGPYLPGAFRSVPIRWTQLLDFQYLSTAGIFGIPLGVSANEIALFIVFAALLLKSGGATLMNNLAIALAGGSPGGSAKVAVLASGLMGTISGSGTANVMTTGSVTIPIMKKSGYAGYFAGAVVAVASTGGQFMPPVLGAAAFILSAFSGVPILQVMKFAIIPAILFYWALFVSVHLEALRLKLPVAEAEMGVKETLRDYGHMVLPVIVLIFMLVQGFTASLAAASAILATLVAAQIRRTTRMSLKDLIEALINGAKSMVVIIAATAGAGIIVANLEITGSGQRLGTLFMSLSGGYQLPALFFAMVFAIILGMGMPTSAAYIIEVATVIPVLLQFGFEPYVVHMFCFYFACLSLITPPVAITAYAAASLAESNLWKTGWTAFRLGLAGYIVPFAFVYGPALLMANSTILDILITSLTALVGVSCLAIGCSGYLLLTLKWYERAIMILASFLLIAPSITTILPGLLLMFLVGGKQYFDNKRLKIQSERS